MGRLSLFVTAFSLAASCGGEGAAPRSVHEDPQAAPREEVVEPEDPARVHAEFERIAAALTQGANPYLSTTGIRLLRRKLKEPALGEDERRALQARLAREVLKSGRVDRAVEILESLVEGAPAVDGALE